MAMQIFYKEILADIEKYVAENNILLERDGFRYIGTTKAVYFIRAVDLRRIFKKFAKRHPDLTMHEFVTLLDSLSLGETYNEFAAVGLLLTAYPKLRQALDPYNLDHWLDHAEGWAEVDAICQLNFTAWEMLADWERWETLLREFVKSENIHKRRASLVLLTKPVGQSDDPRLSNLAFKNVNELKREQGILITKAISWILRSLIKYHWAEVEDYLAVNANALPKIALRETRYKLVGGVKKKTS
jgi:3-methyladenine DNA glycosylase AlkD